METSTSHHRQIELQSAEDFSYLIANVRARAAEHISEAFPPLATGSAAAEGDELRMQIERLVEDFIARTFTLAAPNISINGLPIADPAAFLSGEGGVAAQQPEEQYEPFDGRKRERVMQLAKEEEDLLAEIAALKRAAPREAAAAWSERARSGVAGDEKVLAQTREEVVRAAARGGLWDDNEESAAGKARKNVGGSVLGSAGELLERQDDVERAFVGAVEALARLKRDMPAAVARMEKARVAGEYVVTER